MLVLLTLSSSEVDLFGAEVGTDVYNVILIQGPANALQWHQGDQGG